MFCSYQEMYYSVNNMSVIVDKRLEMVHMALEIGYKPTARFYKTDRNTVRKWCRRYALEGKYFSGGTSMFSEPNVTKSNTENLDRVYQIQSASLTSYTYKAKDYVTANLMKEVILSSTEDDYGTSYYYRGSVENNYVNFSGMCWRIVRVQGNGTVKLVLEDINRECNTADYNTVHEGYDMYISYDEFPYSFTYDSVDDLSYENSVVKKALDSWLNGGEYQYLGYDDNWNPIGATTGTFEPHLDSDKLGETEWCSDIVQTSETFYNGGGSEVEDSTLALYSHLNYASYDRLKDRKDANPTLKCDSSGIGNSVAVKYKNKIGVLTADELAYAGSAIDTNGSRGSIYSHYLGLSEYWTMTPAYFDTEEGAEYAYMLISLSSGSISEGALDLNSSIRPAVVIAKDVTISSGNGTQSNPYVIS